jgi:hypothetical protein
MSIRRFDVGTAYFSLRVLAFTFKRGLMSCKHPKKVSTLILALVIAVAPVAEKARF